LILFSGQDLPVVLRTFFPTLLKSFTLAGISQLLYFQYGFIVHVKTSDELFT